MNYYEIGAVRWKRFNGHGDVRLFRSPKGWETFAEVLNYHPTTDRKLPCAQWWVRETFVGY